MKRTQKVLSILCALALLFSTALRFTNSRVRRLDVLGKRHDAESGFTESGGKFLPFSGGFGADLARSGYFILYLGKRDVQFVNAALIGRNLFLLSFLFFAILI